MKHEKMAMYKYNSELSLNNKCFHLETKKD